jgi:hypothetical protein
MENEKLKRGNELQEQIKRVTEILNQWKEATGLFQGQAAIALPVTRNVTYVPVSNETFTIIRAINITYSMERLAQLEKEFNDL